MRGVCACIRERQRQRDREMYTYGSWLLAFAFLNINVCFDSQLSSEAKRSQTCLWQTTFPRNEDVCEKVFLMPSAKCLQCLLIPRENTLWSVLSRCAFWAPHFESLDLKVFPLSEIFHPGVQGLLEAFLHPAANLPFLSSQVKLNLLQLKRLIDTIGERASLPIPSLCFPGFVPGMAWLHFIPFRMPWSLDLCCSEGTEAGRKDNQGILVVACQPPLPSLWLCSRPQLPFPSAAVCVCLLICVCVCVLWGYVNSPPLSHIAHFHILFLWAPLLPFSLCGLYVCLQILWVWSRSGPLPVSRVTSASCIPPYLLGTRLLLSPPEPP